MYRKKWRKSQPPQKKTLEAYELWVLEWTLLAQQAAPVTPLEAKEAFTDALHRHGGYQDELDELNKYEELKGVELSHMGAHQLIQYELSWRSNRDVAMEVDKGESDADLRQMCGRRTERNKGNRSRPAPIDFSKVPADACLYCGNKGHRAADCRLKQADQKNGTPGKRQKQWSRKPDNGDRKSDGGKNGLAVVLTGAMVVALTVGKLVAVTVRRINRMAGMVPKMVVSVVAIMPLKKLLPRQRRG